MQAKSLFSNWTPLAALLLIGGALAWMLKLAVIIYTNGQIINTGAAALLMKVGLLMLLVGSTGIGYRLSKNRTLLLRVLAMVLSPLVLFGSFLLFAMISTPLFENSQVWYAQQEAPIGLAVFVYMAIGYLLYRSSKQESNI
jgi:hypothetical protein